jgi:hypothetical protein
VDTKKEVPLDDIALYKYPRIEITFRDKAQEQKMPTESVSLVMTGKREL